MLALLKSDSSAEVIASRYLGVPDLEVELMGLEGPTYTMRLAA
jgi:hypothetical protein